MTVMQNMLEDDYAPATRSLAPALLSLAALVAVIAALVWWWRSEGRGA
jgi:hypothetical protein